LINFMVFNEVIFDEVIIPHNFAVNEFGIVNNPRVMLRVVHEYLLKF
jgi:hypothetical protein